MDQLWRYGSWEPRSLRGYAEQFHFAWFGKSRLLELGEGGGRDSLRVYDQLIDALGREAVAAALVSEEQVRILLGKDEAAARQTIDAIWEAHPRPTLRPDVDWSWLPGERFGRGGAE